jgi:hypothetical protein
MLMTFIGSCAQIKGVGCGDKKKGLRLSVSPF